MKKFLKKPLFLNPVYSWILTMAFLFITLVCKGQVQQLKGGNMENKASWFIYNLGSVTPAKLEWNYSALKPTNGKDGCLRISSAQPTSVLLWQKLTVKAGEVYSVDGAFKTNNVANFWAEITVSTIPPIEKKDYSPNNNTDIVQGFSTWKGCGANVNGTFKSDACTGKKLFIVPGPGNAVVDIFFALKIGSSASPLPTPMEVFIDELALIRNAAAGNSIESLSVGTLSTTVQEVTIPSNLKAIQLLSSLSISPYASIKILNSSGVTLPDTSVVKSDAKIVVAAENGISKTYTIHTTGSPLQTEKINNYAGTVTAYKNRILEFNGNCQITITGKDNPLEGSIANLNSEDVWLYFPEVKPSLFNAEYAKHIYVNGNPAAVDKNIRFEQYLQGTMVISHSSSFKALEVFNGENLTGIPMQLGINSYYRTSQLGTMNNAIKSFVLKKGYMATFAQEDQGLGTSKVYIAYHADVIVNKLPAGLYNDVSFIKVIPWKWTTKKGWTSGVESAQALHASWQYDWDNASTSTLDVEYIPMRHNMNWNAYANINNKIKSTHALGFNEPDRTDQANIPVETAISAWPEMLKSGLRVGSPCPSDASAGLTWLYKFMDRCEQLNYRVDFVVVHWYKGGQTARQFYDWLKAVHLRTKRPVWITEWNNGANWTCCKPTYEQQAKTINEMTNMMDTASFVERYSLYEWVEDTRQMFYQAGVSLTPAGTVYRDNLSPLAYNPDKVTSVVTAVEKAVTGETSETKFSLFPNPADRAVTIHSEGKVEEINLINVNGKKCESIFHPQTSTLEIDQLPSGMYFVEIFDGKNKRILKLIKR